MPRRRKQPPAPPLEHPNQCFENLLLTPKGRQSNGHKIARNTRIDRVPGERGDGYAITLHSTVIVRADSHGILTLNSGGWRTHTTMERINRYLPQDIRLTSTRGLWYITQDITSREYDYETGE